MTVDAQRLPVSPEQRRKILDDPLVKQTLELFEGTIVNMEQLVVSGPQSPDDADDDTE